jgi:hypothetical protein
MPIKQNEHWVENGSAGNLHGSHSSQPADFAKTIRLTMLRLRFGN